MGPKKSKAITIKRSDYRETSQWVTFYTAEYGKINVLAKGSKRKNKKFDGPVDLLNVYHVVFLDKPNQHLKILMEYELEDNFSNLRKDLDRLTRAIYVAEFLNNLTALEDKNTVLFDLALETLNRLNRIKEHETEQDNPANLALFAFETQALKCLGYMPHTRVCARCHKKINSVPKRSVIFNARLGGVVCHHCHRPNDHTIATNLGVLSLYHNLSNRQTSDLSRLRIAPLMNKKLRAMLNYYVSSIVGQPLKTAKIIQTN
ncbi:MAG: DNA repair protein RecO [Planctomycetes bacterium]|nr:DNA repair protein RecO [Planctomycetota bacterium]